MISVAIENASSAADAKDNAKRRCLPRGSRPARIIPNQGYGTIRIHSCFYASRARVGSQTGGRERHAQLVALPGVESAFSRSSRTRGAASAPANDLEMTVPAVRLGPASGSADLTALRIASSSSQKPKEHALANQHDHGTQRIQAVPQHAAGDDTAPRA